MGLLSKKISLQEIVNIAGTDVFNKGQLGLDASKIALEADTGTIDLMVQIALDEASKDAYTYWFIDEAKKASQSNLGRINYLSSANRSLAIASEYKLPKELRGTSHFETIYIVYSEFLKSIGKEPLASVG